MRRPKFCFCGDPAISGQAYCRPHHAENMREWRREVGSRKAWRKGIDDAIEVLSRKGMTQAAEIVRQTLRAA